MRRDRLGLVRPRKMGPVIAKLPRSLCGSVDIARQYGLDIGVVLACCETAPAFLGCHVVVPLATLLVADAAEPTVDLVSLKSVYGQGKVLARGGQTVDFIVEHNRSGSLFIPGKPVLTVVGEKQIKLVQRLVDAYRAGNPAVVTKDLMDGLGSARGC